MAGFRAAIFLLAACSLIEPAVTQMNIDGGRSDLPGMKQDMFDRAQRDKGKPGPQKGKGRPDCPKSDKMSPFFGLAFVSGEVFVKLNSTDEQCKRLITVGGANYTELTNASKTCGPAGEWKKRIVEEMSAVFFQGGLDWVRSENETIEVVTEDGTFEIEVTEGKFNELEQCWARGCECEQAKNPAGRAMLMSLLAVAVVAIGWDSIKLTLEKFTGKKPPSKVQCKKGHKMEEVKFAYSHSCDQCGKSGTQYQCSVSCNYDLCKVCYKAAKKKAKADMAEWIAKHPEDAKKEKSKGSDKEDVDDDDDDKTGAKSESEAAKSEGESEPTKKSEDKSEDEDKSRDGDGEGEAEDKADEKEES
mmetsp:Transcript_101460/g.262276  ORF Transcript_101460/g.262276 Transcript_101460/m.262276 type:complete len:359 (+) Transcript_101460:154-1230(+)